MKCTLTAIIVALLSLAVVMLFPGTCSSPYDARLQHIDSLMDSNPQAAYDSLSLFDSLHLYDDDKASRMRLLMLKAKAQNKLYLPMPSDTIFNEVVSYYDSHGSANDRMLSRYLLGCIYRDQEKYPQTILAYQDAICLADTTETGCDYYLLSCIYSQMGRIYASCNLPSYARESYNKSIWYSIKSEHIREAIFDMEALAYIDYIVGDTLDAVKHALETEKLYRKHGFIKESFSVYPIFIYSYLCRGQYEQAYRLMKKYRLHSGNFDAEGNLKPGREHYYKALGQYFLGISRNDSAEYYFRKLWKCGFYYEAARGLCDLFTKIGKHDSVRTYSAICESEVDSIVKTTRNNPVVQSSGICDFGRIQRLLDEKDNKRIRTIILASTVILLLFSLLLIFFPRKSAISRKLLHLFRFGTLSGDVGMHTKTSSDNPNNILSEADDSMNENAGMMEENKKKVVSDKIACIKKSEIYQKFVMCTTPSVDGKGIQESDWRILEDKVEATFPILYSILIGNHKLTKTEYRVTLLIAVGFRTLEISTILGTTKQTVSNAKNSANYKIYGEYGANMLFGNLKKYM